jgi:hypothetical protein
MFPEALTLPEIFTPEDAKRWQRAIYYSLGASTVGAVDAMINFSLIASAAVQLASKHAKKNSEHLPILPNTDLGSGTGSPVIHYGTQSSQHSINSDLERQLQCFSCCSFTK